MKTKNIFIFGIIFLALIVIGTGCGRTIKISEILNDPDEYMGKEVIVEGTVSNTVKIGELSGFTLVDGNDKIAVSSQTLPEEGKTVVVKGTLMKEVLIGYYIYATKIY